MAQSRPYQVIRLVRQIPSGQGNQQSIDVEVELADTAAIGLQVERLLISTRVPLPLPPDQPTIEVAALIRARDALDRQIEAMTRSP